MIVERPPPLKASSRKRRRGRRSLNALLIREGNKKHPVGLQPPHSGGLCEPKPKPLCIGSDFTYLCVNIERYMKNKAELIVHLEYIGMPSFVGITETWLTDLVGCISIPGYSIVSRRDRCDGRQGGGIVFFARDCVASQIVHVGDSIEYERSWHILHTDVGACLYWLMV